MAIAGSPAAAQSHPVPHGGRVSLLALFFGVMGGPLAWSLQLLVNFALASHVCFPRNMPLHEVLVGWGWIWDLLLAVNLLMLLICLAAGLMSLRSRRLLREEQPGSMGEFLEAGEGRAAARHHRGQGDHRRHAAEHAGEPEALDHGAAERGARKRNARHGV